MVYLIVFNKNFNPKLNENPHIKKKNKYLFFSMILQEENDEYYIIQRRKDNEYKNGWYKFEKG